MSEEREPEVYEVISKLPLELKKMDLLNDIVFEADLIRRSTFLKRVSVGLNEFIDLLNRLSSGEYLITSNIDSKRYVLYIDNGRIASVALTDPLKGERIVGLRALANFIKTIMKSSIQVRLFTIGVEEAAHLTEEELKEETRELPQGKTIPISKEELEKIEELIRMSFRERVEKRVPRERVKKIDLRKLERKLKEVIEDILAYHGYKLVNLKTNLTNDIVTIDVSVKKKKLFGAKSIPEVTERIREEVKTLFIILDIDKNVRVNVKKV